MQRVMMRLNSRLMRWPKEPIPASNWPAMAFDDSGRRYRTGANAVDFTLHHRRTDTLRKLATTPCLVANLGIK